MTLEALPQGDAAIICTMCVNQVLQKRLSDFGMIEGTKIECIRNSKGLRLYKVRGTLLALRNTDSAMIFVELCE